MLFSFGQPADGVIQMAYIVEDIEAEMKRWSADLKAGPWFLLDSFTGVDPIYRGAPSKADVKLAMAPAGHMFIELIQPKDEHPSVYKEKRDASGFGFHHIGLASQDFAADMKAMEAKGYELAFKAGVPTGGSVAYYDTKGKHPFFIELIESGPGLDGFFGSMYKAGINWDGSEPVRPFA